MAAPVSTPQRSGFDTERKCVAIGASMKCEFSLSLFLYQIRYVKARAEFVSDCFQSRHERPRSGSLLTTSNLVLGGRADEPKLYHYDVSDIASRTIMQNELSSASQRSHSLSGVRWSSSCLPNFNCFRFAASLFAVVLIVL